MKFIKQFNALLLASLLVFSSCNKDDEGINPGTAPELPPSSSMEIDFSNFDDSGNTGGREATTDNWSAAAATVGIWNTVLAVGLAVPVASFKMALSKDPTYDRDRKLWVWAFDHIVVGRSFSFELTGELSGDNVKWNMYASEENGFQNVLWYSGLMASDGSSGTWLFNKDGNNPTPYLQVDWLKENDEVASIKYENIEQGSDNYGAYIEFGKTNATDYNRYYEISGTTNVVRIEWNQTTGVGRIQVNSEPYLCWDSAFEDVAC